MKKGEEQLNEKNQEMRELFRTANSTEQLSESFLHDGIEREKAAGEKPPEQTEN
ncbi:MAG TPA: hypothetical protein VNR87_05530 [Flavisolibacter sp.]|nr:hypothetical protein [Flavisolibacter sp.]